MRYGRALLVGSGWAGTLGGLALCVLIFLSAYLAFDDDPHGVKPRKDGVVRLPSVPDAEVPRVPLARPTSRIARGRGGAGRRAHERGHPAAGHEEAARDEAARDPAAARSVDDAPQAPAGGTTPPPVAASPAPAASNPPPESPMPPHRATPSPPTLGERAIWAGGSNPLFRHPLRRRAHAPDRAAQPAQRVALQLGVVLHRAVMAARDDDELRARVARAPGQLARVGDRDRSSPSACISSSGTSSCSTAASSRVLGEQRLERGDVGRELELAAAERAPQAVRARRADRDHRPGADARGGDDREVAAHARPAQGQRDVAEQRRDGGDVGERAAVELAAGRAVPALVEADRRQPRCAGRAGEVVVALLARSRPVQDHHAGPRIGVGEPQRVGQPVDLAELGRGSGGLIAHNRRASWPPRR